MDEIRCAIEFREDDSRVSPGLLTGTLMQYEVKASDRPEVFVRVLLGGLNPVSF